MFLKIGHLHLTYFFPIMLVVKIPDFPNPGVLRSKPLNSSKVNSAYPPSEISTRVLETPVLEMSTKNSWGPGFSLLGA